MRLVIGRWPTLGSARRYTSLATTSNAEGPPGGHEDLYELPVVASPGATADELFDNVRRRIFEYEIFPRTWVGFRVIPGPRITTGCTVVQRFGRAGCFVESATRVVDVWDRRTPDGGRAAGFAYVTLQGHPERGVATFEVLKTGDGVVVRLTARSTPGIRLTRFGAPLTRAIQRALTRRAVRGLATGGTSPAST